jgi:hypothetical membrane protein
MQPGCLSIRPVLARVGRVRASALAWLALGGTIAYLIIDVLLAFLRPHYSLIYNAESDYGRGPWSWVMDLNFLLRCALSMAAVGALHKATPQARSRTGLALLFAWATCSGLLAFFPDDLEGQPLRGSGTVHLALAFLAFCCVTAATITISVGLRRDPRWHRARPLLLASSIAGAAAFLLLCHTAGHQHAPGGLYERVFLGLELAWIAAATGRIVSGRPSTPAPADRAADQHVLSGHAPMAQRRSVPAGALGPDHPDRDALAPGVGDDICGAAEAARWLPVPDRPQLIRVADHELAGGHVRLGGGLSEGHLADLSGPRQQGVVFSESPRRQSGSVLLRGNDRLDPPTGIQHRAGEDLIGPVSQAGQPCHRTRLLVQGAGDRVTYQAGRGTGQATMTGNGYASHPILLATA